MESLLSFILLFAIVIMIAVILYGASKQKPELLSMRNLFLAGLIVFQYTSGIVEFLNPDPTNPYAITDRSKPETLYVLVLFLFTIGFFLIYRSGFIAKKLITHVNKRQVYVTWPKLVVLALIFFVIGALCRTVLHYIPYFGLFAYMFGAAFLSLATGLAAWAWVPRIFNPIPFFTTVIVVLGGLGVLFSDSFGRRDMVGIVLAFVWGAYYSSWRYMPYKKLVLRFGFTSIIGMVFLAAFTSTRHIFGTTDVASVGERVTALATADIKLGVEDLFSGQHAAAYSMYFIKTRPDTIEYDTLHSLRLFLTLPIPRAMWSNKPDALALTSVKEINPVGKPPGWNIGPGLVGHIFNDNPVLALPIYVFILAIFFRVVDELLSKYSYDPFVVLPMGVALGQVIGIARGELGNFFAKTVLYMIGGWIAMQIIARLLQIVSPASSMLIEEDDSEDQRDDAYQNASGYGDFDSASSDADFDADSYENRVG